MQKALAVLLVIVLVAAGVGYLVLERQYTSKVERITAETHAQVAACQNKATEVIREYAEDSATVLSVTLADDIARQEFAAVDAELAAIVQGHRIAGVIVVDQEGKVLAATDLRYRGRSLDDEATRQALAVERVTSAATAPSPGQLEVDAPVFSGGQRLATLRIFYDVRGLTP
ncbi:MAG: hypothetical protein GXP47_12235 [Acidobacteria bacterium]|nr:hypothetical protein [Acidobacteriota bacterium]